MALLPISPLPSAAALRKDHNIFIKVIEAKNLPPDCNDMHCVVRIDSNVQTQFKTRTIWKNRTPFWDEDVDFTLDKHFKEIVVEVWHKTKFTTNALVGFVKIPKLSLELDNRTHEDWYPLRPPKKGDANEEAQAEEEARKHEMKPTSFNVPVSCDHCGKIIWGSKSHASKCSFCGFNCHKECESASTRQSCGSVGVVRIKYKYTDEYILPLPTYAKILELFNDKNLEVIVAYGSVTEEREEAAKTLVRIADFTGNVVDFLSRLLAVEVQSCIDVNTIFRANSLASKAVDYYMKLVGMQYLVNILKPAMDEIIAANRSCEIDATRIDKSEELEANKAVLSAYIEWVVSRILDSVGSCPMPLRRVFYSLSQEVVKKWPDNEQVRYICVSGFIFLRFFNAAILGPKLFGLCAEHPNQRVSRTLTLLSKTVQQLANLVRFDGKKEPYMTPFNEFIITNTDKMKMFIRKLSSLPENEKNASVKVHNDRRNSLVDKSMPWKKNKSQVTMSKKILEDLRPPADQIDVTIELAAIHRAFLRAREALIKKNAVENNPEVSKLFVILNEMDYIYNMRAKEVEVEREDYIRKLLEEELSLEEILGGDPKSTTPAQSYAKAIQGVSAPVASPLQNIMVPLGKTMCAADDVFDFLDMHGTGAISRSDFELILGAYGFSMTCEPVRKAFVATSLSPTAASIPRSDFTALMTALVPYLAPSKSPKTNSLIPPMSPSSPMVPFSFSNPISSTGNVEAMLTFANADDLNAATTVVLSYLAKNHLIPSANSPVSAKLLTKITSMGNAHLDQAQTQPLRQLIEAEKDGQINLGSFVAGVLTSS